MLTTFYDRLSEGRGHSPGIHLRIPPDARYARVVRAAVVEYCSTNGVSDRDLESLLFALGEALANAIEHSHAGGIDVFCAIDDDEVRATVIDSGHGFTHMPPDSAPLPDLFAERGRGIPIMQRCTDIFSIDSLPGSGTMVTVGCYRHNRAGYQETATIA